MNIAYREKPKKYFSSGVCVLLITGMCLVATGGAIRAEETIPDESDSAVSNVTQDANATTTPGIILTEETASDNATSSPDIQTDVATSTSADDAAQMASDIADLTASSDPAAINNETGADSVNSSTNTVNNQTNITNQNQAVVFNDSVLRADTGKNSANFNTGSGIITTQDAKGQGDLMNIINKNRVQTDGGVPSPAVAQNDDTGSGSDNLATTNINNQLTIRNINESNTVNRLRAEVNSGQNSANYNTGHGLVLTGDASLGLNFLTMANTNLVGSQRFYANWQNVYSSWIGDIDLSAQAAYDLSPLSGLLVEASNRSTGKDSNNQAIVNVNDETTIINQNSGRIANEISARAISGQNHAEQNTGTGSVASGDVNSSVNVVNFLNSNINSGNWWFKTLNVFGNWNGSLKLPTMYNPNLQTLASGSQSGTNSETGAGSENSAQINVENSLTVENQNDAVISNTVNMKTNTGDNQTSYNGGSGIVKFGKADAETNEVNVANLNVTGDSWWLVVVNNFGSWQGTAVGSPQDVVVKATGISTVISPQGSGVEVRNNSTGPESNNIAGANINHSTDIENTNQADISNVLNVEAISGENVAQRNTGHGYVETGDIRGVNNLVNFANANITVGNWMVVVVNVFGDWSGNLVFSTPEGGVALNNLGGQGSGTGASAASNSGTGSGSDNTANSTTNNTTDINNNNNANLNNNTNASSLTGENNANYNTGSGIVTTGSANTNSSVGNVVNNNDVGVGSGICGSGSQSSANSETGAGSENNSDVTNNCDTDITNNNDATVNNNYSAINNTGQNSANYNTGDGIVDTSWANTYLQLYNEQNENQITLGDLVDDFEQASTTPPGGEIEIPNDNGGSGSGSQAVLSGGGNSIAGIASAPPPPPPIKRYLKGDINKDGKVDDFDFSILMANWGLAMKNKDADTNMDGKVDDFDFSIVMSDWNRTLAVMY